MTFWMWRGLRRGIVTTRYPDQPEPSTDALPTPPVFRSSLLTDDLVDEMVAVCPSHALARTGDLLVYDVGACSACGLCLQIAGEAARPSGMLELAATDRNELVRTIVIGGNPDGH